ncbi:hypothetical protein [Tenacibaculum amylolyticum]|uniref:hypothetical protein n=1 Tax=Tenacibaculum amylolyticum TaxID=104269 RepID=UPI003894A0E1
MKNSIKNILLESLKAAEKTLEADLNKDEDSKKVTQYILHFFKFLGIDIIEKLVNEGKVYIQHQVHEGIHKATIVVSKVVSSLITLLTGFLIICVGLIFGAVAFSLWIGSLIGSNALGFLIAGGLWIIVALIAVKILFNKKRLEKIISEKIKY